MVMCSRLCPRLPLLSFLFSLLLWPRVPRVRAVSIGGQAIQRKGLTPVLGRGYSIATGAFTSTCLIVGKITETSYNYEYQIIDINDSLDIDTGVSESIGASAGLFGVGADVSESYSKAVKTNSQSHNIIVRMAVDRYYGSVDEAMSYLSKDAKDILTKGDFIGFFQACGPTYVRSIRRTGEVVAILNYFSTSRTMSTSFKGEMGINAMAWGVGAKARAESSTESSTSSFNSNVRIKINVYGLSLMEGIASLAATSIEDLDDVMKNAFRSMQNEKSGLVSSIDVQPWVGFPDFHVAAKTHRKMEKSVCFNAVETEIACTSSSGDIASQDSYNIPATLKDFNVIANAELVVKLDMIFRAKMATVSLMSQCIGMLSMKTGLEQLFVQNQRKVIDHNQDPSTAPTIQAVDLDIIKGDRLLTFLMGEETDGNGMTTFLVERITNDMLALMEHYFGPCLEEMAEDDLQFGGGKILSTHWMSMNSCSEVACTFSGSKVVTIGGTRSCQMDTVLGTNTALQLQENYCMPIYYRNSQHPGLPQYNMDDRPQDPDQKMLESNEAPKYVDSENEEAIEVVDPQNEEVPEYVDLQKEETPENEENEENEEVLQNEGIPEREETPEHVDLEPTFLPLEEVPEYVDPTPMDPPAKEGGDEETKIEEAEIEEAEIEEGGYETPPADKPEIEEGMEEVGTETPPAEMPGSQKGVAIPGHEMGVETEAPPVETPGSEDPVEGAETKMSGSEETAGIPGYEGGSETPGLEEGREPLKHEETFKEVEGAETLEQEVSAEPLATEEEVKPLETWDRGVEELGETWAGVGEVSKESKQGEYEEMKPHVREEQVHMFGGEEG